MRLPEGLYGPDQTDVAYDPWRAVRATAVRVGPSPDAPVVRTETGEPSRLAKGEIFGRQSTRNPSCSDRPPLRPAIAGYVWGYGVPPASRKSGWVRLADLRADPSYPGRACGPADADFDRRDSNSCGGHCDGRPLTGVGALAGTPVLRAREAYLRYSPGGTAFRYLVDDDLVRLLVHWKEPHPDWVGVEVVRGRWVARGTRGWVLGSSLAPLG